MADIVDQLLMMWLVGLSIILVVGWLMTTPSAEIHVVRVTGSVMICWIAICLGILIGIDYAQMFTIDVILRVG